MEIRTLDNGLTVIVLENHATPIVSIELDVKNGSYTEEPDYNGLSHLYEHMFFKANASIPSQERYMERIRELGAEFNGTTSQERVNYYITLHAENLREGVRFMADALRTPLFDASELERERQVVQAEYDRLESTSGFHLQRALGRLLWGTHYSRKNPIGDRRVIETCTPGKLRTIQARYYVPNNTALLLSGDLDPEEGFAAAAEAFGDWPRGADPFAAYPVPFPSPLDRSRAALVLQPVKTVSVRLSWHGPSLSLDPEGTYAADLLSYIVDQSGSAFHKALVDSGLCTAADLGYFSQCFVGPLTVHLETSAEKLFAAVGTALGELERLVEGGTITDEEIANAKGRLEVRQLYEREDPLSYGNTVGFWWSTAGLDYHRRYIQKMQAVRREEMELLLRRYMLGRPLVLGVMMSPEEASAAGITEERLRAAAEARRRAPRRRRPEPELFEHEGVEVLHKFVPDAEVAAVQLYLRGGVSNFGAGPAGIERLLLEASRRGGRDHDRAAIESFLSRTGSALRVTAGRDFARLSLYGVRAHLEAGLDILLDIATHPALEPSEVELMRSRLLTEARRKLADPQSLLGRRAMEQFYRGGPYALDPDGTVDSIQALTLEDLRRHHTQVFTRRRLLCVAVGNVPREILLGRLSRSFGELPLGDMQIPPLPEPPGATRPQVEIVAREQPTNYVLALFAGPSLSEPEYPAFYAALDHLSHRLFEEVRTKRNLAYAVSASAGSLRSNHGRILVISVDPRQSFEVVAQELERLRSEPIEKKALAATLSQMRTGLLLQRTRTSGQADELGRAHLIGGDGLLAERFDERLAAVTPEAVQAVFERRVRNWNVVLVGNPASVAPEFFLSLLDPDIKTARSG
jgi:zinc protease